MEPTQFSSISVFINLRKQRLRLIKHLWIIINEGFIGNVWKKYGIRHLLSVGERDSADKGEVDSFVQNFKR